jgi:hypothetical protein
MNALLRRSPSSLATLRQALRPARRTIVVGRDGRHWNTAVLMVPQAEEWQIERFGRFSRTAGPGLNVSAAG